MYWHFNSAILPDNHQVVQVTEENGDVCHYIIIEITRGAARAAFKDNGQEIEEISICDDAGFSRRMTREDANQFQTQ